MRSLHFLTLAVVVSSLGCGREATFQVRESVEQLYVTHARPGETLVVVDSANKELASGVVQSRLKELGAAHVRLQVATQAHSMPTLTLA